MWNNEDKPTDTDKTLLLISGSKGGKDVDKQYAKKIANAILSCFSKHGTAKLRCVGAASENNAVKGITIAKLEAMKKDIHLFIDASFTTVILGGEEKTGMLLEVLSFPNPIKNGNINYDEAILKVKGSQGDKQIDKEYVKKLATAICSCFEKQGTALLRYIGAASCNNALKAFAIAKEELKGKEIRCVLDPRFITIQFDKEEKTGMILEVIPVE